MIERWLCVVALSPAFGRPSPDIGRGDTERSAVGVRARMARFPSSIPQIPSEAVTFYVLRFTFYYEPTTSGVEYRQERNALTMPRICPHCGTANDHKATFCGACATQMVSASTALVPVRNKSALPVLSSREKATIGGVALGVAAVALRVGATLLKQFATRPATPSSLPASPPTVLVRRRWVVGDRSGPLNWGEEEIEIHDSGEERGGYRISLK
ncbi:MAG: zinc ribbon domain-containing protein [Ardenticatenales bacterium]|nr:zinc ribbon domain-containing protein [Ardenticatenales bacterium]